MRMPTTKVAANDTTPMLIGHTVPMMNMAGSTSRETPADGHGASCSSLFGWTRPTETPVARWGSHNVPTCEPMAQRRCRTVCTSCNKPDSKRYV